jgi:putative ABC transport system substrate-binding protein
MAFATLSCSSQHDIDYPRSTPLRTPSLRGGLLAYTTDLVDHYRRAASYVDRLLRGAKVRELPVQFPTKFKLVVNLKTAKAVGLTILESFLLRADELIE